jgi:hypothetical protein
MIAFYLGLLTAALWLVAAVLVVAGTLTALLGALVGGRHLSRGIHWLVIWLDEEERARRAVRLKRRLHIYNQARDEEQAVKAKIEQEREVTIVRMHGKTLKQKTEIRRRRERELLAELSENEDRRD